MKYSTEQQVSYGHFLSMVRGGVLRLRPLASAFVGMRERKGISRKVAHEKPFRRKVENVRGTKALREKRFNFGSILHLRTFAFIIVGTVLLVVYINNLLTINALSRENEELRESIGISKSINAALELELQALGAIHNISGKAEEMGLRARITPAVTIGRE